MQKNWSDSRWKGGTPGRVNSVSPKNRDLSLDAVTTSPILVASGEIGHFNLSVVNEGEEVSREFEVEVNGSAAWHREHDSLEPGESRDIDYVMPDMAAWRHIFEFRVISPGDEDPLNDKASWIVVLGALSGQALVSQVFAAPLGDGPEWVELVNASGGDVDLSGWRILDSRGGDGGVIGD